MQLPKAIEILLDLLGEGPQFPPDDRRDAVRLGIEALKRVQFYNRELKVLNPPLLPGETEGVSDGY